MGRGRVCALVAVGLLIVSGAFFYPRISAALFPKPLVSVRIALSRNLSGSLLYLAARQGYFTDEGLNVQLEERSIGREALEAMWNGKADLAAAYDAPIVLSKVAGYDPVVLSEIYTSSGLYGILFRRSLVINGPRDLIGKRIGVPFGTSFQFLLEYYLSTFSIDPNEIRLIDIDPTQMLAALDSGAVDGVMSIDPTLSQMQERGGGRYGKLRIDLYTQICALVTNQEYLKNHGDAVDALLRAIRRAQIFYHSDVPVARGIVSRQLDLPLDATMASTWEKSHFHLGLSALFLTMMQEQITWAKRSGNRASLQMPLIESIIHPEFLNRLEPQLVTYQ